MFFTPTKPFYGPYDAQELLAQVGPEIGVTIVSSSELVYLKHEERYEEVAQIPKHEETLSLSGTQVRDEYLGNGKELPDWFTRPEVADVLMKAYRNTE